MKRALTIAAAVAAFMLFWGCSDSDVLEPDPGDADIGVVQSDLPRDTDPDVAAEDLQTLVAGNHALADALYDVLRADGQGNLLFSPTSIRIAFAMAHAGARGLTADQIAATMHYGLDQADVPPAFNALDLALISRNLPGDDDEDPVELLPANSFWGRKNFPFHQSYLDVLAADFGAGMHVADFLNAPEASRLAINEWVEERTRERIVDLLPEGSITDLTIATLVNALYLKAPWVEEFPEGNTADEDFTLAGGEVVQVPTMKGEMAGGYASGDGYEAAELYLRGEDLSLVIVMPDAGTFADFEDGLDPAGLSAILDGLSPQSMWVEMPRFTFRSKFSLKQAMQQLGMIVPFTGAADFTGIADASLFISGVFHQAFIAVDEKGVEAAAATAIVIDLTSVPGQFEVDRPFLVGVRDRPTGALLFWGRVMDPRS